MKSFPTGVRHILVCILLLSFSGLTTTLAQDLKALEWFTFYGASETEIHHGDRAQSIALFGDDLYVSGNLSGPGNFGAPVRRAYTVPYGDGFIAKMSLSGDGVEWLTFLGGGDWEESCTDIAVNNQGIFVCGYGGTWTSQLPSIRHPH